MNQYHVPPGAILRPDQIPADTLGIKDTKARTISAKFLAAYSDSYDRPTDSSAARELTRTGMTLIDVRCDLFFQQIGRGAQNADFLRREFQTLSGTLVAALGIANVGPDAITGVGLGTAAGLQTFDNYSSVFFFSPDVSAVQELVRRAYGSLREKALSPTNSPQDFDAAIGVLRTYQNVCTAHEIKRLVTEAINKGETVATYGDSDAPKFSAAVDRALVEMAKALTVDTVSLREAILLELLIDGKPALSAEQADYVCQTVSPSLQRRFCAASPVTASGVTINVYALDAAKIDAATKAALVARWVTLRALIGSKYQSDVDTQIAVLNESAPKLRQASLAKAAAEAALATARDAQVKQQEVEKALAAERAKNTAIAASSVQAEGIPSKSVLSVGVK